MIKKIFALIAGFSVSFSLIAWSGKEIIIGKNYEKSVSFAIRYYSDSEWKEIKKNLTDEGFREANKYVGYNLESDDFLVCNDIFHMTLPSIEDVYAKYKTELNSPSKDFTELLSLHNRWFLDGLCVVEICKEYDYSGFIVIAREQDKDKGEKILNIYEDAFHKITGEDVQVRYKERTYENGEVVGWLKYRMHPGGHGVFMNTTYRILPDSFGRNPAPTLLTKFKNFVVNEKFLYAMAGLSALYFGYEYMNQK